MGALKKYLPWVIAAVVGIVLVRKVKFVSDLANKVGLTASV